MNNIDRLKQIFRSEITIKENFILVDNNSSFMNQKQTNEAFSKKWTEYENTNEKDVFYRKQKEWYLQLYGFESENDLKEYLKKKYYILDAGCGLGYKTAWFANLAPHAIVIGMDYSEAAQIAAMNYKHLENLFFIQGDIADTKIKPESIDYVFCDQVLHHTESPEKTFQELTRITQSSGEFSCYVYAKKALPRELLDDHFREKCKDLSHEELMNLSKQMTDLGKQLTELNIKITVPDIPALEINSGEYDLQRFFYWNFLKCFWNEEMGYDTSVMTNYDWYSPSNANRYNEAEYKKMISDNNLDITYFHKEEACYSGRFKKK